MNYYIFLPPVKKPTGGITVLAQVARHIASAGKSVSLVLRQKGAWLPENMDGLDSVLWDDARPGPGDTWLVPEGWVNSLTPGLNAGARCVVYCQNWAYLFSALPEGVTWDKLPVSFIAVSDPVAWFIKKTTRQSAPVIRPYIDRDVFHPPEKKPEDIIEIAYMPRKNKALAAQIINIFQSRGNFGNKKDIAVTPIDGLDRAGVARLLRRAHIFLATGFPEGCPLPPLEAMASGCLPVGFSGFGGWDYMRQAAAANFTPWWPLRQVDWTGNGLWSADGDVLDAALNLEKAVAWQADGAPEMRNAVNAAIETSASYSLEAQRRETLAALGITG